MAISFINFDTSSLLGYYQSQLNNSLLSSTRTASASTSSSKTSSSSSSSNSATAKDVTPWSATLPGQEARDAKVLNTTNWIDLSKVPVLAGRTQDSKTEQDNQKLFALWTAVNNLSYLATMSKRDGVSSGQMAGYNTRFQTGLQQIQDFLDTATFNNFTLQSQAASSTATATAKVPNATFGYTTGSLVKETNIGSALSGVSSTDKFTISVTKAGVTSDVAIDLSQVSGTLTLDNVLKYVNQQLSANGFSTRFKKVLTEGQIDKPDKAWYGIQIDNAANENVSLSSSQATPSLYISGTTGLTTATKDSAADNQGRLLKLTNLSDPTAEFSVNANPSSGTTTASSTVVDSNGNIYVVGSATGDFGSQINAGSQDSYLTKYDSTGKVIWTRMLGSAGTASGASLALNPNGGVTVVGTTDAQLSPTSVVYENKDSFVSQYDSNGNQLWTTQIQTRNNNQGTSVSVDSSGNVYIGGTTTGAIGSGQVKIGGSDAYITKLDSKGKVVYEQQFGTTANDSVAATALTASGDLVVASVQDGHAILSKYAGGDATAAPVWQMDMGDLQATGSLGGITISGNNIYLTGSTANADLTAGGAASVAQANGGGIDAFVFAATDNGSSVTADRVSYLGTSSTDKGGAVTVGPDGTVYVTGTTSGTFAGQTRVGDNTTNMFVAALQADGTTSWVRQYGGLDGQSTGTGISVDPTGSSVLDALGLPTGKVSLLQSSDLLSGTTLRPGDSFQMKIDSNYDRTTTITIDQGETLQSLVTKMNSQLWGAGKASVTYGGGSALKLEVNPGVNITLVAGPDNLDALKRLGLSPGLLSGGTSKTSSSSSTKSKTESSASQTFSLGLNSNLSVATATDAGAARAQLLSVLNAIQKAYQTTNNPLSSDSTTATGSGGSVSAYTQSQLNNYSLAASLLDSTT